MTYAAEVPYAVEAILWILLLAIGGNVLGFAIRLMTRRRS